MSKELMSSSALFKELSKIIDLPPHCTHVSIDLDVDRVPEVTCTYLVTLERRKTTLASTAEEYELVCSRDSKRFNLVEAEATSEPDPL